MKRAIYKRRICGPTIRDVARLAHVSVASVSRVMNGLANVAPEMRERVERAASVLDYVPHSGARSLSLSRFGAIGVILPDLHGEFFSEIVRGMNREASRRKYMLLLSSMRLDGGGVATTMRAMHGRVDGVILLASHISSAVLTKVLPAQTLAVLINGPLEEARWPSLRFDNRAGAEAMIDHLVDTGRRAIVHIRGPVGNRDGDEREEGYRAALKRRLPQLTPVVLSGDFSEECGAAAAAEILDHMPGCDAVFAANDMMAIGCLQSLRGAGIDVPERVAVTGFDDVPLASHLGLTTIRVDIEEIGIRTVTALLNILDGTRPPKSVELPSTTVIIRSTTPPAPSISQTLSSCTRQPIHNPDQQRVCKFAATDEENFQPSIAQHRAGQILTELEPSRSKARRRSH